MYRHGVSWCVTSWTNFHTYSIRHNGMFLSEPQSQVMRDGTYPFSFRVRITIEFARLTSHKLNNVCSYDFVVLCTNLMTPGMTSLNNTAVYVTGLPVQ